MLGLSVSPPTPASVSAAATALIEHDIRSVFRFVARDFFSNYRRWCPQVVELEPDEGTIAEPGVLARQVTLDRGIRSESTFEVVEINEPRHFVLEGRSEPFRTVYEFGPAPEDATELTFRFEMKQLELSMRPFAKLIRAAIQEGAEQTVENLKNILEAGAVVRAEVAS